MHPFTQYVNPHLGKLLADIKLDKEYIRGEGSYLYDSKGNQYLDCIAAYGAIPFGYNHPEIWETILTFQQNLEPTFIQPSYMKAAAELARRLVELTPHGLQYVTFTNSGAETVEVAIKLCRSATGRMGILAAKNSFHGKTLGALSATGKSTYQSAFGAPVPGFEFVEYGNLPALEDELSKHHDQYAAFIIEPIQGEGGIVVPPNGYLRGVREICDKYGVKLIFDEIQTGLGRTGRLFVAEEEGITPDVLLLAKALGGGIIPIGAAICTDEVYNEEFANKHSSTFAGNSLACRVGLKVLELLTREEGRILKEVQIKGDFLKKQLKTLHQKYPQLIRSIRGKGLMLGIEFGIDPDTFPGSMLGVMAEQELLTPIISSYLLNTHKLRVAPTLNGHSVIRIEPSLTITMEQCHYCIQALDQMLERLAEGNTAKFLGFFIEAKENYGTSKVRKQVKRIRPSENPEEGKFAFLIHPIDLKNYYEFDDSLEIFSENELAELIGRCNDLLEPFRVSRTKIQSASGREAYGEFIALPRTTEQLLNMPKKQVIDELKAAVQLAVDGGAKIVGLGAFTSVASMGGLYLKDLGIPLTTGNSYTVVAAVDAVLYALHKLAIPPQAVTAAVVGATGSIGKGTTMLLSQAVPRMILLGNPQNEASSMKRLYSIAGEMYKFALATMQETGQIEGISAQLLKFKEIPKLEAPLSEFAAFAQQINGPDSPVLVTTETDTFLPLADVVISATSSVEKLITPTNVKYGAVVCDLSRPGNVSKEVECNRPDVLVIDGGVIEVPSRPSLGWNFGFEEGLAYACMAETMMLALEQHYMHTSIGSSGVSLESILFTRNLAKQHGFKVADLRSFDRPLSEEKWQSVISLRR